MAKPGSHNVTAWVNYQNERESGDAVYHTMINTYLIFIWETMYSTILRDY